MEEFNVTVRPDRHFRSCDCEACCARRDRLVAYFNGETTDRGTIPGAFTKGEPKRYAAKGRAIMGGDLVRYSDHAPTCTCFQCYQKVFSQSA